MLNRENIKKNRWGLSRSHNNQRYGEPRRQRRGLIIITKCELTTKTTALSSWYSEMVYDDILIPIFTLSQIIVISGYDKSWISMPLW